jgi:UDP-N-acetylmuramoyl-tripeptide--D-alanyl-D-alanine ligase
MSTLSTGELAAIVGGRLRLGSMPPLGGDLEPIGRLSVDSRTVAPGEVFWGLSAQADPANLPEEAFARGAKGVVVEGRRVTPWPGTFSVEVDDAKWALWQVARTMRSRFEGRVIAILGDLGKTMTRAMIETVLGETFHGTSGDDAARHDDPLRVGLPLLLSELNDDEHDFAVVELHGRHPGLIAQLQLCRPDILVLTPTAQADANHRGACRELLAALPHDCLVVVNDDSLWRHAAGESNHTNLMWVGRGAECDLAADRVRLVGGQLQLSLDGLPVRVPVWGRHHLPSVLAAFAVARLMGLSTQQTATALAQFAPPAGRCSVADCGGVTVIDDTCCASAAAARAVIHALRDAARTGRRLLVLGELPGDDSKETYRLLGAGAVGQCGADGMIACGAHADDAVDAARQAGMPTAAAIACRQADDVAAVVAQSARPGDTVLLVGDPGVPADRITRELEADTKQAASESTSPANSGSPVRSFEVPPLASALREAGAALPPGLEH